MGLGISTSPYIRSGYFAESLVIGPFQSRGQIPRFSSHPPTLLFLPTPKDPRNTVENQPMSRPGCRMAEPQLLIQQLKLLIKTPDTYGTEEERHEIKRLGRMASNALEAPFETMQRLVYSVSSNLLLSLPRALPPPSSEMTPSLTRDSHYRWSLPGSDRTASCSLLSRWAKARPISPSSPVPAGSSRAFWSPLWIISAPRAWP